MNINFRDNLFERLSGGEKTRVNLARILLRNGGILLLDEPTNHLDLPSLEWLEGFLLNFAGTVVVISHDRTFLDRSVTRIVEIDDGKAVLYSGNYSFYIEEKESRFLSQAESYKQQQRKIAQLEEAIKRQRVWAQMNPSNSALAKRALAMERRIEKMEKIEKPRTERKLAAGFESADHAAKEILSLNSVSKSFGENIILKDAELKILRNERVALVGANGCGKSTLLKIIMGEEPADSGEIKISTNVNIGYLPQHISFNNMNATVLELFRAETETTEERARAILSRFHFMAADVSKKAATLSGGEKSRLKLCLLMQKNINLLLLDEPTNHLDIISREWIESALADFDGSLLFISHDRYFLDKFAERVIFIEKGRLKFS